MIKPVKGTRSAGIRKTYLSPVTDFAMSYTLESEMKPAFCVALYYAPFFSCSLIFFSIVLIPKSLNISVQQTNFE